MQKSIVLLALGVASFVMIVKISETSTHERNASELALPEEPRPKVTEHDPNPKIDTVAHDPQHATAHDHGEDDHDLPLAPDPDLHRNAFLEVFKGHHADDFTIDRTEKVHWSNCASRSDLTGDLLDQAAGGTGLGALRDEPILDWNRYFTGKGQYYQLSLQWDGEEPRRYRLALFQSRSMTMEDPVQIRLKGDQWLDRDETVQAMDTVSRILITQGMIQTGNSRVIGSPDSTESLVELRNGKVVRLEHESFRCDRPHLAQSLQCRCLAS